MISRLPTTTLPAIAALVLLAACTAGPGGQPPGSVVGRQFLSTAVNQQGVDRPLVAGTRIRLTFEADRIGAQADCNQMGGTYSITAGQLLVGELAMTEMACDAARHEQDAWLAEFLGSGPTLRLSGTDLALEADGTVIRLLDREVAEPDLMLVGTSWGLESIARGDTVSSVPDNPPELLFGADGRVTFTTGCNDGSAGYVVNPQTVRLSGIGTTKRGCIGEMAEIEQAILSVLRSSAVAFHIDGSVLRLSAGDLRLEYRSGRAW